MKWDKVRKQFYLEKSDVTDNTTIEEEDLRAEYGERFEIGLQELSQHVYNYIDSAYRGVHGRQHALAVRKMIYDDANKQVILMDAMNEMLRADIYTGMRLKAYTNEGKANVPDTVQTILRNGNLYIKGNIDIRLEELEGEW